MDDKIVEELEEKIRKITKWLDEYADQSTTFGKLQKERYIKELDEGKKLIKLYKDNNASEKDKQKLIEYSNRISKDYNKELKELDESTRRSRMSFDSLSRDLVNFNSGILNTTSSVYSSKDAFQAFQAPLRLATDTIKKLADIGSAAVSGIPGISGLGEAASKIVTTGLDLAQSVVESQMQMASNLANTFKSVSDSGMTFGGNLDSFAQAAKNSGVNMQQFGEYISKNRDNLFALGGSIADNAVKLTKMGKSIGDTNAGLLASYGSYEALNEGITEYIDLQRRLGRTDMLNQQNLTAEATEYLTRQRELSQLTGKSAQALKDEEAKRRQALDYQLKLSRMSETQQKNVQEAMGMAGRLFGDQGQKFLEEYIATGGKLVTKEALTFQAMQGTAAESMIAMFNQTGKNTDEFRKGVGEELSSRKDALERFARDNEKFAEINRAANSEILTGITQTSAGILANLELIGNYEKMREQLALDRAKGAGGSSQAVADAQKKLVETQREIDELAKKSLTRMSTFIDISHEVQKRVNALAEMSTKFLMVIAGKESLSKEEFETLANRLIHGNANGGAGEISEQVSEEARRTQAINNMGKGGRNPAIKSTIDKIMNNTHEFLRPKVSNDPNVETVPEPPSIPSNIPSLDYQGAENKYLQEQMLAAIRDSNRLAAKQNDTLEKLVRSSA